MRLLFFIPLVVACSAPCTAGLLELEMKIENPRGENGLRDSFGFSAAFVGDNIVVGSRLADGVEQDEGAAHLFDAAGNLLATFTNPQSKRNSGFSLDVSPFGDLIAISGYLNDVDGVNAGVVYLFDQEGTLVHAIENPEPSQSDWFGNSIAEFQNHLLVSAPGESSSGDRRGMIYVYDAEFNLVQQISNPMPESTRSLGFDLVAHSDEFAATATDRNRDDGNSEGVTYLFDSGWSLVETYTNPSMDDDNAFSALGVALGDTRVLVAAERDSTYSEGGGVVFIFDKEGNKIADLKNPNPSLPENEPFGEHFGRDIAIIGDNLVAVGASFDGEDGFENGSLNLFDLEGNWLEKVPNPTNPTETSLSQFGKLHDFKDGRLLVAAQFAGRDGFDAPGAVYIYRVTPEPSLVGLIISTIMWLALTKHFRGHDELKNHSRSRP